MRSKLTAACPLVLVLLVLVLFGVQQASAAHRTACPGRSHHGHTAHACHVKPGAVHRRKSRTHRASAPKRPPAKHEDAGHGPAPSTGHGGGEQGSAAEPSEENAAEEEAGEGLEDAGEAEDGGDE